MPTSAKVRRQTDIRVDEEVSAQTEANKLSREFVKAEQETGWKIINHMHKLIHERKLADNKVKEIYKRAFCTAHKLSYDGRSESKEYNSFFTMLTRMLVLAALPDVVYKDYKMSGKSWTSCWANATGDSSSVKRILKKDSKEAEEKAHMTVLQKRANNGDADAQKELETMKSQEKPAENKTSGTYTYDEWKELKGKLRYYIKEEPRKFFNLILTLTNEEVLNSGWGRLAKREIELIQTGS
jgi:acyl-CoA-binding protein